MIKFASIKEDCKEADDLADEMEVYWLASCVYGDPETKQKVEDIATWLATKIIGPVEKKGE